MPWTGKPGGLQSIRLLRVGHSWAHTSFIGFFLLAYSSRSWWLLLCPTLWAPGNNSPKSVPTPVWRQTLQMECILGSLSLPSRTLLQGWSGFVEQELEFFSCFLCGAPLPEEVFAMGMVTGQWTPKVSGMRMGPSLASPAPRGGERGRRRARALLGTHLWLTASFFLSPCPAQEGGWNN